MFTDLLSFRVSELLNFIRQIMPRGKRKCSNCSALSYSFSKQCTSCGVVFGSKNSGQPINTGASDGYVVGTSGGRPSGTKASDGFSVGGRRRVKKIAFDESVELPTEWDISGETLNLDEDLLSACACRICQPRTFDSKSLGVGVCYGCGHVLFTSVGNVHTYLIDKPSGLTEDDAPASAYIKAVPNCTLTFVYTERGNSTKERWYILLW